MNSPTRSQWLTMLNADLRALHRNLIKIAQEEYEKTNGPVGSPFVLLKLVSENPAFAWLRSLTSVMVRIDELLDAPDEVTKENVDAIKEETARLLHIDRDHASEFSEKYVELMQAHPDLIVAQSSLRKILEASPVK